MAELFNQVPATLISVVYGSQWQHFDVAGDDDDDDDDDDDTDAAVT